MTRGSALVYICNMQIALFRALQSVKIDADHATAVVQQLESHVESVVNNNIKAVEGKLAGMQAELAALNGKITFMTTLLAVIGLAIAATPILAKLIH